MEEKDWKLKLRYGKLKTNYQHFTVIGNGIVNELAEGFECPKGPAYLGMKIWAESIDESADVFASIAQQIGFTISGDIEIFETAPEQPPGEDPFGYDIHFTPYSI